MPKSRESAGFALGLVAMVLFGASLPAARISVLELDPFFVTVARAVIGGTVGLILLAFLRPRWPKGVLGSMLAASLCLVILFPGSLAVASVTVPSAHGSVILGLLPLATTFGAVVFSGERPSLAFWLLSLAGAAVVTAFALYDGDIDMVIGDLFLMVAMLSVGSGYAIAANLTQKMPGWQVTAGAIVLSLPVAVPLLVLWWPADAASVSTGAWGGILFSGIMVQFVAYAIWNVALAWGGVARVGQVQLLQPFVTFLIAVPLLGEHVDGAMIAFAVAVVVIVALTRRAAVRRPAQAANI